MILMMIIETAYLQFILPLASGENTLYTFLPPTNTNINTDPNTNTNTDTNTWFT